MNGCQETPWREELDGKELHGAAWWRVRSEAERVRFFLYISAGINTTLTNIYKCGIIVVLMEAVFSSGFLCCYTVPDTLFRLVPGELGFLFIRTNRMMFERNLHL